MVFLSVPRHSMSYVYLHVVHVYSMLNRPYIECFVWKWTWKFFVIFRPGDLGHHHLPLFALGSLRCGWHIHLPHGRAKTMDPTGDLSPGPAAKRVMYGDVVITFVSNEK